MSGLLFLPDGPVPFTDATPTPVPPSGDGFDILDVLSPWPPFNSLDLAVDPAVPTAIHSTFTRAAGEPDPIASTMEPA